MAVVGHTVTSPDRNDNQVMLKICASFVDCRSEINNTPVDNAKDIDIVMPIENLIKCIDSYS